LILPVLHQDTSLTTPFAFSLGNLDSETVYDVRVRAVNKFGQSRFSETHSFYLKTDRVARTETGTRLLQTEDKDVTSGGGLAVMDMLVMCVLQIVIVRCS
jgi:hypothetical protein